MDQGALDFARENGIPCGGWCPLGRLCETGRIPDRYPVTEVSSDDYNYRTRQNILDSDGTLIIIRGDLIEPGTGLTKILCEQYGKPVLILDLDKPLMKESLRKKFRTWISTSNIRILNIAGNRESSSPGIQEETRELVELIIAVKCRSSKQSGLNG